MAGANFIHKRHCLGQGFVPTPGSATHIPPAVRRLAPFERDSPKGEDWLLLRGYLLITRTDLDGFFLKRGFLMHPGSSGGCCQVVLKKKLGPGGDSNLRLEAKVF